MAGGTRNVSSFTDSWHEAAKELGIVVRAPFQLVDPGSSDEIECVAHVESFGAPQGSIVLAYWQLNDHRAARWAQARGYYVSRINAAHYQKFARDLFIATLNGWGWRGDPNQAPDWYNGGLSDD